eukprot:8823999-Ditylum_brightwellii.AAC.1
MGMVCNWITSNYLPKQFWYFGLCVAAHVCSYTPIQTDDCLWSSPFELAYGKKPDWRNLIPMFCMSYVKHHCGSTIHCSTSDSQSTKCICVGQDIKSDGLLFYIPHTKQLISSSDYYLDPTIPSVPTFNLHYNDGIHFNFYHDCCETFRSPQFQPSDHVFITQDDGTSYLPATILATPDYPVTDYTVCLHDTLDDIQMSPLSVNDINPATVADTTS